MTDSLVRILPEIVLLAGVFALLALDLLWKNEASRRTALLVVSVISLLAAAGVLAGSSADDVAAFSGMIAVDGFARFFMALFLVVAFFGVFLGYASDEIPHERFGEFLILLFCVTLGLFFLSKAQNLLMIYLSIELVSIPSYILAGFRRGDRRSSEAALKYVIYGAAASGLMLYGFSLLYGLTGSMDLAKVAHALQSLNTATPGTHLVMAVAVIFSLAGFCYKAAAVPFHMWCPDVYEGAPTPFVAFLSVGPKAAGLAALARFLLVGYGPPTGAHALPWPVIIGILSVATMTLGNVVAIAQNNVKRLLAYSSIAHAGYLLLGIAVGTSEALQAVMMYLGIYLAMNMGAFAAVMAVRSMTGSEDISAYKGLGAQKPFMAVMMAIFLFSLTGVPPFGGFIGKFYLFAAVIHAHTTFFYVLALIGVLNSAISLYAYARVLRAMFLDGPEGEVSAAPVTRVITAVLAILAVPTVILGIWWSPLIAAIERSSSLLH